MKPARLAAQVQQALRQQGELIYRQDLVWTDGTFTYPAACSLRAVAALPASQAEAWGRTPGFQEGDLMVSWAQGVRVPPLGSRTVWQGRTLLLVYTGTVSDFTGQPRSLARWTAST